MNQTATGACLCGGVQFSVQLPSNWVAHCYCEMCRRAHGAGFVTWVGVASSGFHVTAGEELLRCYNSSSGARRSFCSRCGSTLLFESDRWPGETHITLANFTTPVDRLPHANAFTENRADWVALQEVHDMET